MCSFARLQKYLEYLKSVYQKATLGKTKAKLLRFAPGDHQGRDSTVGASIPIWANGAFKPARVGLIHGKAALLLGMDIIRKLDITVRFGGDRFMVGQSEWKLWRLMKSAIVYFL